MTKREFLDTVFALAPNEANAIIDAFDEYVDSNKKIDCDKVDKCEKLQLPPANNSEIPNSSDTISRAKAIEVIDSFNVFESRCDQIKLEQMIGELPPAQSAQPAPDQNGDLWITVPDIDEVTCVYVQESKSKFCRIFYEER